MNTYIWKLFGLLKRINSLNEWKNILTSQVYLHKWNHFAIQCYEIALDEFDVCRMI